MDDRVWKNVSIVLGVVCAVLIGVAGALMVVNKNDGSSGSSPDASADASLIADDTSSPGLDTPGPSGPTSSGSIAPNGSPTPGGSPGTAGPATITFNSMMLDPSTDANHTARTFTFQSDASGPVTWAVTKVSPSGIVRICYDVDTDNQAAKCRNTTAGKLYTSTGAGSTGTPDKPDTWTITFVGMNTFACTVDLQFTWPTTSPKIKLDYGRLQGSATDGVSEALNGFSATFKPRKAGPLSLEATWSAITADVDVSLYDASVSPPVGLDERPYSQATYLHPVYTHNVDGSHTYLLKLRNKSNDAGRPNLTAQISFP